MTEHISTEEAERIAFAIQGRAMEVTGAGELVYDEELRAAAAALRSLAAERDRLGNEVEHHVEELDLRMKAIREQEKRMAALAAERDGLRIAVINAAFALQRIREIADLSPTWWNDPSAGVGRIAADAERELRVALGKAQP